MDRWIIERNIDRFRELLASDELTDEQRATIARLLAEEQAKKNGRRRRAPGAKHANQSHVISEGSVTKSVHPGVETIEAANRNHGHPCGVQREKQRDLHDWQ
jgi:hypothetical protein